MIWGARYFNLSPERAQGDILPTEAGRPEADFSRSIADNHALQVGVHFCFASVPSSTSAVPKTTWRGHG